MSCAVTVTGKLCAKVPIHIGAGFLLPRPTQARAKVDLEGLVCLIVESGKSRDR